MLRARGQPRSLNYQVDGVAVEGLVGLEYRLTPQLALSGDYKLSLSSNEPDLVGGGSLETDIWTNHLTFGVSYRFGSGGVPEPYQPY